MSRSFKDNINSKVILNWARTRPTKHKIIFVSGVIAGVIVLLVVVNNSNSVSCSEVSQRASEVISGSGHRLDEAKNKYSEIRDQAYGCKEKGTKSQNDSLGLLTFYYNMAVNSYSFGDKERAQTYADKVLQLNEKVSDDKRPPSLLKTASMKEAMGWIKDGTY